MDIQMTAREVGLFETAKNLSAVIESKDIAEKVGALMPLPGADVADRIDDIAKWILSCGKAKYLFLTPEIALANAIVNLSCENLEIVFTIPSDMDKEAKERLKNNLPCNTSVLEESFFPENFFPRNGMMVACGYFAAERQMVLWDTYRLIEHYSGFLGKKAFVPYVEVSSAVRYDGWLEIKPQRLNVSWNRESI